LSRSITTRLDSDARDLTDRRQPKRAISYHGLWFRDDASLPVGSFRRMLFLLEAGVARLAK
jgi:hypothetical protein